MANYFDQFDAPAAQPNPFDQFDTPAAQPNPFDRFDAPATPKASAAPRRRGTLIDTIMSVPTGVVRGAVETAMLPATLKRLGEAGVGYVTDRGEDLVRTIMGWPAPTQADRAARQQAAQQSASGPIYGAQDVVRGAMDAVLPKPQTTPGKYAQTISEFAVPGAAPSKVVRGLAKEGAAWLMPYISETIGNAVVPAVLSQTAGDMAEGTRFEAPARIAGAVVGGVGNAALRGWSTPESVMRRMAPPPGDQAWTEARKLQDTAQHVGVNLTGPELVAAATGGGSDLPTLMRAVEGSVDGGKVTKAFFAKRPEQVDKAVGSWLDTIAPAAQNPSALGPRAAAVAERAIAASPEGQALADAIWRAGPRTTEMQAGEVIQPALRGVFDRREGMRNALADQSYEAARRAPPRIAVENLPVAKTVREPGYTQLKPGENPITGTPEMQPSYVDPTIQTPSMTSRTGPDLIQVDARPVLRTVDRLMVNAKADTRAALQRARNMLFAKGGVDTSVGGIDSARNQLGDMVTAAKRNGQMQQADHLLEVQRALDSALADVPEYARANAVFKNASEPLAPFQSPGMDSVVARDEFNKAFRLPAEQVPGKLTTPAEARAFNEVAPPDARTAMENHVATRILDSATDGAGNVSAERMAVALRDNEDLLSQFPGVAERLQSVFDAASGMQGARVGPIGNVAAASTTRGAADALLPRKPIYGGANEAGAAALQLSVQDPGITNQLVRQAIGQRYQDVSAPTREAGREFVGGKFATDIAGAGTGRREVLDAVLDNLSDKTALREAGPTLDTLAAINHRRAIGSPTETNRAIAEETGQASAWPLALDIARAYGANIMAKGSDAVTRWTKRGAMNSLAKMFVSPDSLARMEAAAGRSAPLNFPEAAARSVIQGSIAQPQSTPVYIYGGGR